MDRIQELQKRLTELQARHAQSSLSTPRSEKEFEYGRVVGVHQGLTLAIQEISKLLSEEDSRD